MVVALKIARLHGNVNKRVRIRALGTKTVVREFVALPLGI